MSSKFQTPETKSFSLEMAMPYPQFVKHNAVFPNTLQDLGPEILIALKTVRCTRRATSYVEIPCECVSCLRSEFLSRSRQARTPYQLLPNPDLSVNALNPVVKFGHYFRTTLQLVLSLHGKTVIKRWRRKLPVERQRSLIAAQPAISPHADFLFMSNVVKSGSNYNIDVVASLSQYVNLAALCENSNNLLGLLYYRASHHPSDFAIFDANHVQLPWSLNLYGHEYSEGAISMVQKDYGRYHKIDMNSIHRGDSFGFPKGALTLTAQVELMLFLLEVVATLLHDCLPKASWLALDDGRDFTLKIDSMNLWCRRILLENSSALNTVDDVSDDADDAFRTHFLKTLSVQRPKDWTSLYAKQRGQAYLGPPIFDIVELMELAQGRLQEAQDDLWLLQTDPQFFHDRMISTEQNLCQCVNSQFLGGTHYAVRPESIMQNVFIPLIVTVEWYDLIDDIRRVQEAQIGHESEIQPGQALPSHYDKALGCLHFRTDLMLIGLRDLLRLTLATSATYGQYYDTIQVKGRHELRWRLRDLPEAYKKDKVITLLEILTRNPERMRYDPMSALNQLEQSLAEYPIDPSVEKIISALLSDICILEYILQACRLHRPHHKLLTLEDVFKLDQAGWQRSKAMCCLEKNPGVDMQQPRGFNNFRMTAFRAMEKLCIACYPLEKFLVRSDQNDKQWLDEMNTARRHLITVWEEAFAVQVKVLTEHGLARTHQQIYNESILKQYKSPEHLASLEREKGKFLQNVLATKALREISLVEAVDLSKPVSIPPPINNELNSPKRFTSQPKKSKTKTRGKPAQATERPPVMPELTCQTSYSVLILYCLEPKHFTVIDLLFGGPNGESTRGSTEWFAFVSTMLRLGFSAVHCGGSAVNFEGVVPVPGGTGDTTIQRKQSIVVHKPHPTRMEREIMRHIGKRLSKRLGWERAHFEVKDEGVKVDDGCKDQQ